MLVVPECLWANLVFSGIAQWSEFVVCQCQTSWQTGSPSHFQLILCRCPEDLIITMLDVGLKCFYFLFIFLSLYVEATLIMGDDSEWMKLPADQKCEHKVMYGSVLVVV